MGHGAENKVLDYMNLFFIFWGRQENGALFKNAL